MATKLSEKLGTECWVNWRHIAKERKPHIDRHENIKIFKFLPILKYVTAHFVSSTNESHLQPADVW